jgi:hypothetical protein
MYFVNEKQFNELLDAITYCKSRPTTTLTDMHGTILMRHEPVSFETFREIWMTQQVLEYQMCQLDPQGPLVEWQTQQA